LTHGQAVALGMVFASWLSANLLGFKDASRVEQTLINFGLPTRGAFDIEKVFNVLENGQKKNQQNHELYFVEKNRQGRNQ